MTDPAFGRWLRQSLPGPEGAGKDTGFGARAGMRASLFVAVCVFRLSDVDGCPGCRRR